MLGEQQSIPPDVYDREYFMSEICEGFEEAKRGEVSFNKAKQVAMLKPGPGVHILDAGCGRGETLAACARAGATVAGIDYSAAAVDLTREMLEDYPDADLRVGSITDLPWEDNTFDRVQFSDVIEHIDAPQTVPALAEFHRVLKPGGYLVVHTAPNLWFMKVGWPLSRPFVKLAGHRETAAKVDHWFKVAEDYHVNEQSARSLKRHLKAAGFTELKTWVDPDVLRGGQFHLLQGFEGPVVKLAKKVAAFGPMPLLLGNDVIGIAHKS